MLSSCSGNAASARPNLFMSQPTSKAPRLMSKARTTETMDDQRQVMKAPPSQKLIIFLNFLTASVSEKHVSLDSN